MRIVVLTAGWESQSLRECSLSRTARTCSQEEASEHELLKSPARHSLEKGRGGRNARSLRS